ncbi:MAG: acetylornithine deacetylase, partial [Gemmatimonadaceae bacterium]|nr:acetylornithine deacetylase [Caulobacter sp.]
MRLNDEDRAVLDHLAGQGAPIIERAIAWCAINSGSHHLAGLERQRQSLLEAFAGLPAAPTEIPLAASPEIGANGKIGERAHPSAIAV